MSGIQILDVVTSPFSPSMHCPPLEKDIYWPLIQLFIRAYKQFFLKLLKTNSIECLLITFQVYVNMKKSSNEILFLICLIYDTYHNMYKILSEFDLFIC